MVASVSFVDQRIGSKTEQATASVPTEAVVVAQPARISSGIGSSAARIVRLANEIEGKGGELREGFGPASILRLPEVIWRALMIATAASAGHRFRA
jgi:hypothetical protein